MKKIISNAVLIVRKDGKYFVDTPSGKVKVALEFSHLVKFLEGFFFEGEGKII